MKVKEILGRTKNELKKMIKRIFCHHEFEHWAEATAIRTLRQDKYVMLTIRCCKCEKEKTIYFYDRRKTT